MCHEDCNCLKSVIQEDRGVENSDETDGIYPAQLVISEGRKKTTLSIVIILEQRGTTRKRGYSAGYENNGFRDGS